MWFEYNLFCPLPPNRYSKLMGDEPDLDPDINKDFFENNVLQLDPSLLTENGMKCFERFFKAVNCREGKLVAKRRAYMMDDLELIGLDYLWRVRRNDAMGTHKQCVYWGGRLSFYAIYSCINFKKTFKIEKEISV